MYSTNNTILTEVVRPSEEIWNQLINIPVIKHDTVGGDGLEHMVQTAEHGGFSFFHPFTYFFINSIQAFLFIHLFIYFILFFCLQRKCQHQHVRTNEVPPQSNTLVKARTISLEI